jgi:P2 family phage contractile tail tube protein
MSNLRDSNIFQDFTVWVDGVGKIGEAPEFQPPEINIAVEEFRGGGMDGTVEIPMGIEKIEFDFQLHTWDAQIWTKIGYGPGSLDVPVTFRGYLLTPGGAEKGVVISTRSLIKSVKPGKISAGKKADMTVNLVANVLTHKIDNQIVASIDVFNKITIIGGTDKSSNARRILGFSY